MVRLMIAAVVVSLGFVANGLAADEAPPNFIFVMADDLGYGDLGCYGQKQIQTPRLDQMAREGMRFTDFYAGATVCAPSRCVLMTGLHTGHCFIRGNSKENLRPSDVTVAEVLKSAGYTTALCGKWGLGHEGSTGVPTRQGFDYFFGYLDQHHAHNYYPAFLMRGDERVELKNVVPPGGKRNADLGSGVATKKVDYSHDLVMDDALAWIESQHERPFFLYLALTIPHANNQAGKLGMEVPELGEYADKPWPDPQKGTAAMITRMDRDMGRLFDKLKELSIDENTIVLFTSDNGPHREGGNNPDFFDSNGPLRGIKRALYDGGIRVPLIVRWPGRIEAGAANDHVGYFADWLATAAELAGTKPPAEHDGISFTPTLLGEDDKQREHDYLYWEFHEGGHKRAVRMGQWKGVRNNWDGPVELYDVSEDVGEENDVAKDHPDVVDRVKQAMREARTPSQIWRVPGEQRNSSKKTQAARSFQPINAATPGNAFNQRAEVRVAGRSC